MFVLLGVPACVPAPEVQFHPSDAYPERLSAWGVLEKRGDRLVLGRDVIPYDVNTPLFMDHALKLRTVWMPPERSAAFASHDRLVLPEGTVLSKTFFYPAPGGVARAADGWHGAVQRLDLAMTRLVETRLLVKQPSGWEALPYVWRGDDAYLAVTGDLQGFDLTVQANTVSLDYVVPTRNECTSCHATGAARELLPLGIRTRHLNRGYHGAPDNQLAGWQERGLLTGLPDTPGWPRSADWRLGKGSTEHLARSYLDANCGHCHNPASVTDTSGLWLDYRDHPLRRMGACKPPIAAGRGTGGHPYSIVPGRPQASILTFRMAATDPSIRMPELGRTLVDHRAVEIVGRWVASLEGTCE